MESVESVESAQETAALIAEKVALKALMFVDTCYVFVDWIWCD